MWREMYSGFVSFNEKRLIPDTEVTMPDFRGRDGFKLLKYPNESNEVLVVFVRS